MSEFARYSNTLEPEIITRTGIAEGRAHPIHHATRWQGKGCGNDRGPPLGWIARQRFAGGLVSEDDCLHRLYRICTVGFSRHDRPGRCMPPLPDSFSHEAFYDFFFGTFLPFWRASESPMAIACFLLLTVLPLFPLFSRLASFYASRS